MGSCDNIGCVSQSRYITLYMGRDTTGSGTQKEHHYHSSGVHK